MKHLLPPALLLVSTAPPSATFFRFEDKKTAFQGDSAAGITVPLAVN